MRIRVLGFCLSLYAAFAAAALASPAGPASLHEVATQHGFAAQHSTKVLAADAIPGGEDPGPR